jgi:hypothetical protein
LDKIEFRPYENMLDMETMKITASCDNMMKENTENKEIEDIKEIKEMKEMEENIDNFPLAMAYVPIQKWKNIYANDVALNRGTIFSDLDLPFLGCGGEES